MLIIFDLDDTLIDTSGGITPFKMGECLKRAASLGLELDALDVAHRELLLLNEKMPRSQEALVAFLEKKGAHPAVIRGALQELFSPLPSGFKVPLTPNAKEILEACASKHLVALVTSGFPPFQREKLEKAGLDSTLFSKISIPEAPMKRGSYEEILEEFSLKPAEVFVCGDRISIDLLPAYELGCRTVHMRWGRGGKSPSERWIDYAISDLNELRGIVL